MPPATKPRPGDLIIAGAGALLVLLYSNLAIVDPTPARGVEAALSCGFTLALVFWRSRVQAVAWAVLILLCLWGLNWLISLPTNLGVSPWLLTAPMIVWSTARHLTTRPWWGRGVLTATLAGALVSPAMWRVSLDGLTYRSGGDWLIFLLVHWLILVCAYLLAARQVAREQARRQRIDAAVNERELLLRAAREEERILIAGEIHDVLAHSLTLIKVNANAGLKLGARRPELMSDYLGEVRTASSQGLDQLRDIVTALRGQPGELQPAPTLAALPEIIADFERAGLRISTALPADLIRWNSELPVLTQLAVVRIVTEGLTNVLRHQGGEADVALRLEVGDRISVRLTSTTAEPPGHRPSEGTGTGLTGLAERARALGGTLHAEGDAREFRLHTELPVTTGKDEHAH